MRATSSRFYERAVAWRQRQVLPVRACLSALWKKFSPFGRKRARRGARLRAKRPAAAAIQRSRAMRVLVVVKCAFWPSHKARARSMRRQYGKNKRVVVEKGSACRRHGKIFKNAMLRAKRKMAKGAKMPRAAPASGKGMQSGMCRLLCAPCAQSANGGRYMCRPYLLCSIRMLRRDDSFHAQRGICYCSLIPKI